ncbi:hypothetical protein M1E11_10135 [Bacillus sp. JZ8]
MIQLREDHVVKIGQKVKVYRNLHKDLFSIQDALSKKVIAHGEGFLLKNVKFHVQENGRKKVVEMRRKRVHAFIVGEYMGVSKENKTLYREVYYNPYVTKQFIDLMNNEPIVQSDYCFLDNNVCYVK